ncbi:hypothetical protein CHLNCDRAFT_35166 [Chlorella variabilis]|uniref:VWFA domain-containing protein n=1 Tax=Chlorella variabilis TaxID=554065 RepID=E1ZDH4_CHLVA|nr:hypothetical protein CHLNCDRAFT_35166 [Chlorella variabilis]EFN56223.1 hypothetical protein CHLNCDRAFT_35166 [Chlorella variabilis]|eukprot:XP_005848325.1 hypothetical protein CHLNCDRAFT_35166 [Chlorella variabilis]
MAGAGAGAAAGGGIGGAAASETLGFATGGAQDVENFRTNLEAGYLPLPTDLTYEGLAKDYYFDTSSNATKPCTKLFCPLYSVGLSPDPLLGTPASSEFYMAVGLDSGMKAADFARKQLNLVVVLDVSGSMGSPFDSYYYDQTVQPTAGVPDEGETKKKIDVAKEVLAGIVGLLRPDDSLSVVLFSDAACVPKPLGPVRCADVDKLKEQISADVVEMGGTNFQAGIDAGGAQLTGCAACMEANASLVENRVVFLTDAQPNAGDDSEQGLLARIKALSADGIYTTIIGVGLDFNTQLVESIGKVRGSNYFSVHTPGEFRRRLVDEFDYAVT